MPRDKCSMSLWKSLVRRDWTPGTADEQETEGRTVRLARKVGLSSPAPQLRSSHQPEKETFTLRIPQTLWQPQDNALDTGVKGRDLAWEAQLLECFFLI